MGGESRHPSISGVDPSNTSEKLPVTGSDDEADDASGSSVSEFVQDSDDDADENEAAGLNVQDIARELAEMQERRRIYESEKQNLHRLDEELRSIEAHILKDSSAGSGTSALPPSVSAELQQFLGEGGLVQDQVSQRRAQLQAEQELKNRQIEESQRREREFPQVAFDKSKYGSTDRHIHDRALSKDVSRRQMASRKRRRTRMLHFPEEKVEMLDFQKHLKEDEKNEGNELLRTTIGSTLMGEGAEEQHPFTQDPRMEDKVKKLHDRAADRDAAKKSSALNGREFPVDPYWDSEGVRAMNGTIVEIEKLLKQIASRSDSAIDLGPLDRSIGIVISDARAEDMPVVYASEACFPMLEYTLADMYGQNCRMLQFPDDVNIALRRRFTNANAALHMRKRIMQGLDTQACLVNYTRSGRPFVNLCTIVPYFDTPQARKESRPAFFVGFILDLVRHPERVLGRNANGTFIVDYRNLTNPARPLSFGDDSEEAEMSASLSVAPVRRSAFKPFLKYMSEADRKESASHVSEYMAYLLEDKPIVTSPRPFIGGSESPLLSVPSPEVSSGAPGSEPRENAKLASSEGLPQTSLSSSSSSHHQGSTADDVQSATSAEEHVKFAPSSTDMETLSEAPIGSSSGDMSDDDLDEPTSLTGGHRFSRNNRLRSLTDMHAIEAALSKEALLRLPSNWKERLAADDPDPEFRRLVFEFLSEQGSDTLMVLDLKGRILYCSQRALQISGYTAEQLLGNTIRQICHPNDIVYVLKYLKALKTHPSGAFVSLMFRCLHVICGYQWIEAFGSFYKFGDEKQFVSLNARPFEGPHLSVSQLRQASNIGDTEFWMKLSRGGLILSATKLCLHILGLPASSIVGQSFASLIAANKRNRWYSLLSRAFKGRPGAMKVHLDVPGRRILLPAAIFFFSNKRSSSVWRRPSHVLACLKVDHDILTHSRPYFVPSGALHNLLSLESSLSSKPTPAGEIHRAHQSVAQDFFSPSVSYLRKTTVPASWPRERSSVMPLFLDASAKATNALDATAPEDNDLVMPSHIPAWLERGRTWSTAVYQNQNKVKDDAESHEDMFKELAGMRCSIYPFEFQQIVLSNQRFLRDRSQLLAQWRSRAALLQKILRLDPETALSLSSNYTALKGHIQSIPVDQLELAVRHILDTEAGSRPSSTASSLHPPSVASESLLGTKDNGDVHHRKKIRPAQPDRDHFDPTANSLDADLAVFSTMSGLIQDPLSLASVANNPYSSVVPPPNPVDPFFLNTFQPPFANSAASGGVNNKVQPEGPQSLVSLGSIPPHLVPHLDRNKVYPGLNIFDGQQFNAQSMQSQPNPNPQPNFSTDFSSVNQAGVPPEAYGNAQADPNQQEVQNQLNALFAQNWALGGPALPYLGDLFNAPPSENP